jgi:hypothetical protein
MTSGKQKVPLRRWPILSILMSKGAPDNLQPWLLRHSELHKTKKRNLFQKKKTVKNWWLSQNTVM